MDKNLRSCLAELIGTFLLVFFGSGILCSLQLPYAAESSSLFVAIVALTQGLSLGVLLSITMRISSGFLNPAVVPVLYVFKRMDLPQAVGLVAAQLLGALLAGLLLRGLFTEDVFHRAAPHVNLEAFGLTVFDRGMMTTGAGIELMMSFLLAFAIFGAVFEPQAARFGGLIVGLALAIAVFFGFPLTGAAVNPARWLGMYVWDTARVVRTVWDEVFVYVIGPVAGALLAGVLFWYGLFSAEAKKSLAAPR